jgi:hypothetical protein
MPKKSSFDFTIFDKYEWTGKGCAKVDFNKRIEYLQQDLQDIKAENRMDPRVREVLGFYREGEMETCGRVYKWQKSAMAGNRWQRMVANGDSLATAIKYLIDSGYLQASQTSLVQSSIEIEAVAPPSESRSESSLSPSSVSTSEPEFKVENDSKRQKRVKKPKVEGPKVETDIQKLLNEFQRCMKAYKQLDLNPYAVGENLGIAKKMINELGLESSMLVIKWGVQDSEFFDYLTKSGTSLKNLYWIKLAILDHARVQQRNLDFFLRTEGQGDVADE